MKNFIKIPLISSALLFAMASSAMQERPFCLDVCTEDDIKRLYDAGIKPEVKEQIFLHAAKVGDRKIVAALLDKGVYVNVRDSRDRGGRSTALYLAASHGHAPVVRLLLERKANVNAKHESLETPLHSAARDGSEEVAKCLIAAGADLNARTEGGTTPLDQACMRKNSKLAKLLASVMAYQGIYFPKSEQEQEEVEIGREIGLAMREAEANRDGYPQSQKPEHAQIIEFIKTLKKPKLRSRI